MAVTINEIAKAAGVSNAAVSRYLNGGSRKNVCFHCRSVCPILKRP